MYWGGISRLSRRLYWFSGVSVFAAFCLIGSTGFGLAQSPDYDPNNILEDGASSFPSWYWEANISTVGQNYRHYGDPTQGVNSNLGYFGYVDFDFFSNYQLSPFEQVRFSAAGAYNRSVYRHPTIDGFLLERGTFYWEKGDAALPFRLEAGDFFGDYSLRTLQTGLKGLQIEIQPEISSIEGAQASIQFTAGEQHSIYNTLKPGNNFFAGMSALIATGKWDASINAIYNTQPVANSGARNEQAIGSVAFNRRFNAGSHRLTFEGEGAYFSGGSDLNDNQGNGYYFNLAGYSTTSTLTYDFTHDAYSKYFTPAGGSVSSNRRSYSALISYRQKNNWLSRLRLQRFENAYQSVNPSVTHVAGLSYSGAIPSFSEGGKDIFASTNNFISFTKNKDRTTDSYTYSTSGRLSRALGERANIAVGAGYTRTQNRLDGTRNDRLYGDATFDTYFDIGKAVAHLGLGTTAARSRSTLSHSYTLGPKLDFNIDYLNHSLSLNYGFNHQWSRDVNNIANRNWGHAASLYYSYTKGKNSFGAEVSYDQSDALNRSSYGDLRVKVSYTRRLGKTSSGTKDVTTPDIEFAGGSAELTLFELRPGSRIANIIEVLDQNGLGEPERVQNVLVYEVDWITSVAERQRLAIVAKSGREEKAVLLVDLSSQSDGSQIERTYRKVLDSFVGNYGSPETSNLGDYSGNISRDVRVGKLRRVADWKLPNGVLRVGLVSDINRRLRIEAHYARILPDITNTRWGLSKVR